MADELQSVPEVETQAPPEGEELGEAGLTALQRERESRKTLEKQTRELQRQVRDLQRQVSPEAAEAAQKLEAAQAEIEARYQQQLQATQKAHEKQIAELNRLAKEKEAAATSAAKTAAYMEAFTAAGGRNENGFSTALQQLIGDRLQLVDGTLQVVENGAPVLGDDGKPVNAVAWLASLKTDPLYGHFFAPDRQGFGGGTPPGIPGAAPSGGAMSALDLLRYGLGG